VITCRSISSTAWAHAREALIFYFIRRHGITNAEDLAQDTLTALLSREDFEFEKEEDFLRVCYAFAMHVSQAGYRKTRKHAGCEFDPAVHDPARRTQGLGVHTLNSAELNLLLDEVIRIGKTELNKNEWTAICAAAEGNSLAAGSNRFRVQLFRARQKLVRLTNWRKSPT
jgi:hypothetical protein